MGKRIFFNSSLPRSGSTLLQNILAQNPRFYASPTSGVFDILLAGRTQYTSLSQFRGQDPDLMKRGFLALCEGALQGFYSAITDRPVCVDKSRDWFHYYDWVRAFHPQPKMLVCIRDLRAILSSMEKLYRNNRHLTDFAEDQARMNMVTVQNRVRQWLGSAPVGQSVMRLRDAMQMGTSDAFHFIRYEDLTTQPRRTMLRLYEYLEEEPFEHDFAHVEQITKEDDTLHPFYGDHSIRTKVEPAPMDYNEVLGPALAEAIRRDNQFFYQAFYGDKKS